MQILLGQFMLQQLPWLMLGDYNELLSSHDKLEGNPLNPRRVQLFKKCLDACGMVDLGLERMDVAGRVPHLSPTRLLARRCQV